MRWAHVGSMLAAIGLACCAPLLGDFDVSDTAGDGGLGAGDDGGLGADGADVRCPPGQKACAGACVSTDDPAYGCAGIGCGACAVANATAACVAGACAIAKCATGWDDCVNGASDGCETSTATDPAHCGACTTSCSGGTPNCGGGQCSAVACTAPLADCNAVGSCSVDTSKDVASCGACKHVCGAANGTPTCASSACTFACTAPFAHCPTSDDAKGCDVDTSKDDKNCGKCGNVCAAGTHCASSRCVCDVTSCAGGCCNGAGQCTTPAAISCGTGGGACIDCTAKVLNASGASCSATGACAYSTCKAGFLDADGDPTNGCESQSPAAIPEYANLLFWYVADGWQGSTWVDQGPAGRNASCSGGMCPALTANAIAGHAALTFNGSTNYFVLPAGFASWPGATYEIVWRSTNTAQQYDPILSFNLINANDTNRYQFGHGGGDTNLLYSVCTNGTCPGAGSGVWLSSWHRMALQHNANATVSIYLDGVGQGVFFFNGANGTVPLPSTQTRSYNYLGNDTYGRFLAGQIAEIIVYNTAISSASLTSNETYLSHKYKL